MLGLFGLFGLLGLLGQITFDEETTTTTGLSPAAGGAIAIFTILYLLFIFAFAALMIASFWKLFSKAGQPGWAAIVPILNIVVLWKLLKLEVFWLIFAFVPCVNIVWGVAMPFFVAKAYGKSAAYGVGLLLLPFIFFPMLAFGSSQYQYEPDPLF